jgi:hypothetical protein
MAEYSYRIKNKLSLFYSKGGILPVWTTDPQFAKLWPSKRGIKSHIAQCKRKINSRISSGLSVPPEHLPDNWTVQEIRLELHNTFDANKFV